MKALRGVVGVLLLAAVLVWAAGACCAQEPVTLEYKFTPNQTLKYVIYLNGSGAVTMTPAPPQMPAMSMNLQANLDLVQHVASVDPNGAAALDLTIPRAAALVKAAGQSIHATLKSGKVAVTVNGEEQKIPPVDLSKMPLVTVPLQVTMDKRGKMLDLKLPNMDFIKQAMGNMDLSQLVKSSSQNELPDKPVQLGESWSSEIKTVLPGTTEPVVTKATYTLAGVDTVGDQQIARITFTVASNATGLTMAPPATGMPAGTPPVSVTIDEMVQNLTGTTWFSVTSGQATRTEVAMTVKEAMSMSSPQGPQKMNLVMDMKLSMVRK